MSCRLHVPLFSIAALLLGCGERSINAGSTDLQIVRGLATTTPPAQTPKDAEPVQFELLFSKVEQPPPVAMLLPKVVALAKITPNKLLVASEAGSFLLDEATNAIEELKAPVEAKENELFVVLPSGNFWIVHPQNVSFGMKDGDEGGKKIVTSLTEVNPTQKKVAVLGMGENFLFVRVEMNIYLFQKVENELRRLDIDVSKRVKSEADLPVSAGVASNGNTLWLASPQSISFLFAEEKGWRWPKSIPLSLKEIEGSLRSIALSFADPAKLTLENKAAAITEKGLFVGTLP